MDGSTKSYIVNYQILANVDKASQAFSTLATAAGDLEAKLVPVSTAIKDVSRAMGEIARHAKDFTFTPKVDAAPFLQQLRSMEEAVVASARVMRNALYGAMQNKPVNKALLERSALAAAKTNIAAYKKEIEDVEKQLDKYIGKKDSVNGRRKGGLLQNRKLDHVTKAQYQAEKANLEAQKKELEEKIKEEQKKVNTTAKQEAKNQAATQKAAQKTNSAIAQTAKTAKAAQTVLLSPEQAKAYTKLLNARSKTLSVRVGIPKDALSKLDAIINKLKELKAPVVSISFKGDFASLTEQIKAFRPPVISISAKLAGLSGIKDQIKNFTGAKTGVAGTSRAPGKTGVSATTPKPTTITPRGIWPPGPVFTTEDEKELTRLTGQGRKLKSGERDTLRALQRRKMESDIGRRLTDEEYAKAQQEAKKIAKYTGMAGPLKTQQVKSFERAKAYMASLRPQVPTASAQANEQLAYLNSKTATVKLLLDPSAAVTTLNEFVAQVRATSATMKLTATGTGGATGATGGSTQGRGTGMGTTGTMPRNRGSQQTATQRASYSQTRNNNRMIPIAQNQQQFKLLTQYRKYFEMAARKTGFNLVPGSTPFDDAAYLRAVSNEMVAAKTAVPFQLQARILAVEAKNAKNLQDIRKAEENAAKLEQQQKAAQRAANSRIRNHNRMLPIAQTQQQLKLLTQYRKYFEMAARRTGFSLAPGSKPFETASYLRAVSDEMMAANQAVPWQLQQALNKANGVGGGGSGSGGGRGLYLGGRRQQPFDVRSRRWSYPFTGPTSFGVRTPMAFDMAKGMGVMFAISGAMSAISNSFTQAMDYQNTMETTRAILKTGTGTYSPDNFSNMERIVREVGIKTKFSAPEVASAAKFLAMAGYDIESINNAIRPIADLALIGDYDLGETADKMTNIMTTFGATAESLKQNPKLMRQMGNVMNAVATRSNTDVMMLAESAKYGGGVAKMYGGDDPNIFADTMAIFGIMGNAGIQGSSAGTALRMMYQNIFNPNRKQAAILSMLESRGLRVRKEDGTKNSMADILMWMANNLPKNEQADIISKLFRITAQPGANAAINAAANANAMSLMSLAAEEGTNVEEVAKGYSAITSMLEQEGGLGALAKLMIAARNSVNSDALGENAAAKQNTISGLWAQVTSTFTEGIVQAFEQRKGGFEGMLKSLRDWFANPETITMLQRLLDLIVEIGKVMATFARIWAKLYSLAPGLIKTWMVVQMTITQIGSLMMPFQALINVFSKLRVATSTLTGASVGGSFLGGTRRLAPLAGSVVPQIANTGVSAASAATTTAATTAATSAVATRAATTAASRGLGSAATNAAVNAASMAPFMLGGRNWYGGAARLTGNQARNARIMVSNLMGAGMSEAEAIAATQAHYANVRRRASQMYGRRSLGRAFLRTASWVPVFSGMFGGIRSMFMGLMRALATGVGLLVNPITIALGAIAVGVHYVNRANKYAQGNTAAQMAGLQTIRKEIIATNQTIKQSTGWYDELIRKQSKKFNYGEISVSDESLKPLEELEKRRSELKAKYPLVFTKLSGDELSFAALEEMRQMWDAIESSQMFKWATKNTVNVKQAAPNAKELTTGWNYWSGKFQSSEMFPNLTKADWEEYKDRFAGAWNTMPIVAWIKNGTPIQHETWLKWLNEREALRIQQRSAQNIIVSEALESAEVQSAMANILAVAEKYNWDLDNANYIAEVDEIFAQAVHSTGGPIDASNWTPEQMLQNIGNLPKTIQYGKAVRNLLEEQINGGWGTFLGKVRAEQELLQGKYELYSAEWLKNVMQLVHQHFVSIPVLVGDTIETLKIELNTLPDGRLDFSSIQKQFQEKINGYKLNMTDFFNVIKAQMKIMAQVANLNLADFDTANSLFNSVVGGAIGSKDAISLDANKIWDFIDKNPNNEFVKAFNKFDQMDQIDIVSELTRNPESIIYPTFRNGVESLNVLDMRDEIINADVQKVVDSIVKEASTESPVTKKATTSSSTSGPNATKQDAYASSYQKGAAKPAYVTNNFTINFDKTMVASSADERDMLMAMENKMASVFTTMINTTANAISEAVTA